MASVRQEIEIEAHPDDVWAALRDFGAVHERLAPGFVVDARLDGDTRVVTFFNGAVARELLVDRDDESRRLVYSVINSPLGLTHHNASAQVVADGETHSRFVWITDLLPGRAADRVRELMEHGARVIKQTLESEVAPR
jgi:carbon monoxide dehydrogenase subunit G